MSCAAARYDRQRVHVRSVPEVGVPKGIRTPVTAVKGRCPGPLDDGDTAAPRQAGAEDYTTDVRPTNEVSGAPRRSARRGPHGPRHAFVKDQSSDVQNLKVALTFQNAPGRSYVPAS